MATVVLASVALALANSAEQAQSPVEFVQVTEFAPDYVVADTDSYVVSANEQDMRNAEQGEYLVAIADENKVPINFDKIDRGMPVQPMNERPIVVELAPQAEQQGTPVAALVERHGRGKSAPRPAHRRHHHAKRHHRRPHRHHRHHRRPHRHHRHRHHRHRHPRRHHRRHRHRHPRRHHRRHRRRRRRGGFFKRLMRKAKRAVKKAKRKVVRKAKKVGKKLRRKAKKAVKKIKRKLRKVLRRPKRKHRKHRKHHKKPKCDARCQKRRALKKKRALLRAKRKAKLQKMRKVKGDIKRIFGGMYKDIIGTYKNKDVMKLYDERTNTAQARLRRLGTEETMLVKKIASEGGMKQRYDANPTVYTTFPPSQIPKPNYAP